MIKKNCAYCGKEIEVVRPQYKYCSKKCLNKALYRNYGKAWQKRRQEEKRLEKYSKDQLIQCQICGKWYRQVGTHIWLIHGYTAREYREEFGFDVKRGQLPEDYRKLKSEQAFECGGVKNLKVGKKYWFKEGDPSLGRYKRSQQTLKRLKKQGEKIGRLYDGKGKLKNNN